MVGAILALMSPRFLWSYKACALRQDLATLPQGDQTEVGEKG